MSDFIPASPAEVTAEWVTTAMRDAGALDEASVVGVAVEEISDGGTGFTGETVRLRLDYDGEAVPLPSTVVAKFATSDRQNRGMLEQFDAYAREIRFYQRWAHRMPCPIPTFLGADYDDWGAKRSRPWVARFVDALPEHMQLLLTRDITRYMRATRRRYALLLEDLGSDTTVHDMVAPPGEAQLTAALDTLASVHAAFWDDPLLEDEDDVFRPLVTDTPGLYQTVGRRRCLALARERWDWLTEERTGVVADALHRFPEDLDLVNTTRTLVHGDPRADNLLFRASGEVVLLDWALASHAHPGFDVGYLLSSCVPEDRAERVDSLIVSYHEAMVRRGIAVDGEELWRVIAATYRVLTVQQLMSISVLHGGYGDQMLADYWLPRLLAGLDRINCRVASAG